jgi:hypothetical protein
MFYVLLQMRNKGPGGTNNLPPLPGIGLRGGGLEAAGGLNSGGAGMPGFDPGGEPVPLAGREDKFAALPVFAVAYGDGAR